MALREVLLHVRIRRDPGRQEADGRDHHEEPATKGSAVLAEALPPGLGGGFRTAGSFIGRGPPAIRNCLSNLLRSVTYCLRIACHLLGRLIQMVVFL
jgi:hypothetical protein